MPVSCQALIFRVQMPLTEKVLGHSVEASVSVMVLLVAVKPLVALVPLVCEEQLLAVCDGPEAERDDVGDSKDVRQLLAGVNSSNKDTKGMGHSK